MNSENKATAWNQNRDAFTRKSVFHRPQFAIGAVPKSKGCSVGETKTWMHAAITAKVQSSSSSENSSPRIGNQRTSSESGSDHLVEVHANESGLITLPAEQAEDVGAPLAVDRVEASVSSLCVLLRLDPDQANALKSDPHVMKCLAHLKPGRLDHREGKSGNAVLRQAPPLELVRALANSRLGAEAARALVASCPQAKVVAFATKLLNDREQPANMEGAIQECAARANRRLQRHSPDALANTALATRFQQALQTSRPMSEAPMAIALHAEQTQRSDLARPEHKWISKVGNSVLQTPEERRAREARMRFATISAGLGKLGPASPPADREAVGQSMQQLCADVATSDPEMLANLEGLASLHGIKLVPAPSSKAFWFGIADKKGKDALFFASQAQAALSGRTSMPSAIARIVEHFPEAKGPWLKLFRAFAMDWVAQARSPEEKEHCSNIYWQTVAPRELPEHEYSAVTFAAGDIGKALAQTGLDAETFIHMRLQANKLEPLGKEELASLYIAGVIQGVHTSPLLHFPLASQKAAFGQFMRVLAGFQLEGDVGVAESVAHLVVGTQGGNNHLFVMKTALALMKSQPLTEAVDNICAFLGQWSDVRNYLLRTLAAGGHEYEVLLRAGAYLEREDPSSISGFFSDFGAMYPLSPDTLQKLGNSRKADKHAPPAMDRAIATFARGRLGEILRNGRAPGTIGSHERNTQQMQAVSWKEFEALLTQAKAVLPLGTFKDMVNKLMDELAEEAKSGTTLLDDACWKQHRDVRMLAETLLLRK